MLLSTHLMMKVQYSFCNLILLDVKGLKTFFLNIFEENAVGYGKGLLAGSANRDLHSCGQ